MTMINWSDIRKQFPVTSHSVYLNTAAAGPLAISTQQAATQYYQQMMNDGDVHWDDWLAKREQGRAEVARLMNAETEEIGVATKKWDGMNLIIDSLEKHGEVISNDLEFPVTTIPWMHRRIPVHIVKAIGGVVTAGAIRAAMDVRTGIIATSYVQYSNGFRTNLAELVAPKGTHSLVVHVSQAAGAFEIDVKRMRIDALCSTGHKWMLSGYGSGFVYISKELQERSKPRIIGWLSDEVRLRHDVSARAELGCPHFAGIFALGASVEMMLGIGLREIEGRVLELNRYLTKRLAEEGLKVLSPLDVESHRSAETLVSTDEPSKAVSSLAAKKIFVTEKPQGFRVATDFFNDEADIERLIESLA